MSAQAEIDQEVKVWPGAPIKLLWLTSQKADNEGFSFLRNCGAASVGRSTSFDSFCVHLVHVIRRMICSDNKDDMGIVSS